MLAPHPGLATHAAPLPNGDRRDRLDWYGTSAHDTGPRDPVARHARKRSGKRNRVVRTGRPCRDGNARSGGFRGGAGTASCDWETPRADDGAEARSGASHSHRTVPAARPDAPVRTGLYHPLARTFPNAGIRTRPRLSPRTHKGPASHMAHGSPGAHAIVAPASRLRPRSRGATRPRCPARPDAPRSSCDRRQGRGRAPGRRR